jgi:hypothetical protein
VNIVFRGVSHGTDRLRQGARRGLARTRTSCRWEDRHPRQMGAVSDEHPDAHVAALAPPCRPHRDRTVRGGVEVMTAANGLLPDVVELSRTATMPDRHTSPNSTIVGTSGTLATCHPAPPRHLPAGPCARSDPRRAPLGLVTGRTQLNAVGDKSPYSLIPSSARQVHPPDPDDILAPRQSLAAYPRFRHWAGSVRRSITFYCVRAMMLVS